MQARSVLTVDDVSPGTLAPTSTAPIATARELIGDAAGRWPSDDIDVFVPWNIAGRYPAELGDPGPETAASTVDAASRIVDALSRRVLPGG